MVTQTQFQNQYLTRKTPDNGNKNKKCQTDYFRFKLAEVNVFNVTTLSLKEYLPARNRQNLVERSKNKVFNQKK